MNISPTFRSEDGLALVSSFNTMLIERIVMRLAVTNGWHCLSPWEEFIHGLGPDQQRYFVVSLLGQSVATEILHLVSS